MRAAGLLVVCAGVLACDMRIDWEGGPDRDFTQPSYGLVHTIDSLDAVVPFARVSWTAGPWGEWSTDTTDRDGSALLLLARPSQLDFVRMVAEDPTGSLRSDTAAFSVVPGDTLVVVLTLVAAPLPR